MHKTLFPATVITLKYKNLSEWLKTRLRVCYEFNKYLYGDLYACGDGRSYSRLLLALSPALFHLLSIRNIPKHKSLSNRFKMRLTRYCKNTEEKAEKKRGNPLATSSKIVSPPNRSAAYLEYS